MKTHAVPHYPRPVSRIVCGTDFLMGQSPSESFRALDAYFEAGGRTFDTAHCYGANTNIFAAWTTSRKIKDEVIYFDKGCHPYGRSRVTHADMRDDILTNQRNLAVERTDFFVLHRDDPNVPVGEIIDWLNEFKQEGLILAFGGSNWHHTRIEAANAYAEANGKQGFSLSNPNLALAYAQDALWHGCLSADADARAWHTAANFPLFAWSSAARGFFAGTTDPDVLRCFDNETNRQRRDRATEFGLQRGLSPTQVAIAWVLNQPYPTFALSGLRNEENVKENLAILDLELSPEDVRWLETGEA